MPRKGSFRVVDKDHDEVQSYMEQLMNDESSNLANIGVDQNDELGYVEVRKARGPTLLKDIWNMSPGKKIDVQFNSRNQAIGKEGRKLASFLGIIARNSKLTPLNIDDWRCFDQEQKNKLVELVKRKFSIPTRGEHFVKKSMGKKWKEYKCELRSTYLTTYKTKEVLLKNRPSHIPRDQWTGLVSYWFSDKGKRRSQANRNNRAKQKMPHTRGSKSIGTLMAENAKDGIEPTRAEIFILTHKKRKDGRPLDEESTKVVDMIQEKLNIGQTSKEQPIGSVAWEGDVYSQVLGEEKSGYVRGLGLGPTPSLLWGSKSSTKNTLVSNEIIQRLEQEMRELKKKQHEEMDLMKQNQEKLLSELLFIRKIVYKHFPADLVQVDVANSGYKQASKSSQHEIDDQKIASPHDQKPVKSSPNHFNSEGVIAWETKSTSNQNSSWGASMENKEIIIDPNHSSGWGKGGGKRDPVEHKIRSPSHNTTNKIIKLQSSPTMIVKTEKNKQSIVQASELFSLLKLLRKENDESIRKTAAEALFKLSMED